MGHNFKADTLKSRGEDVSSHRRWTKIKAWRKNNKKKNERKGIILS